MIEEIISAIYPHQDEAMFLKEAISERIKGYKNKNIRPRKGQWDQDDVFLITYGDQFYEDGETKLTTFNKMYQQFFSDTFPIVHFLPFFPYSSDDGFSVIDYEQVNPEIGDWADVQVMNRNARLMFDFVCNHMSAKSNWFQGYLNNRTSYKDFFIESDPSIDLSMVTRPRTSPLLSEFVDLDGKIRNIWTTFSDDQVDLNFANPKVLLRMIDVLLFYVDQGADFIRLDAVGFLWKKAGTSSIHLPETHKIIQLFRSIVEEVAPGTILITETNMPHQDNISYFGDGTNEAQMVYQFPLPPLVLHAIRTGNTSYLQKWANEIYLPTEEVSFFNFLASHDGIGLNPIRGIIDETEILDLVASIEKEGALVNYKQNPDCSFSPYEINTTYIDALSNQSDEDELRLKRFMVAHSILLTIIGIPAVYVQSILGGRNYYEGVEKTGANRTINRQKYKASEICDSLLKSGSFRNQVYRELQELIQLRRSEEAFHPNCAMRVLETNHATFGIVRDEKVYVLHNMSDQAQTISLDAGTYINLLTKKECDIQQEVILEPYQFVWLEKI
ncbi:alpha-amylase family glycosyl hydrolase [Enterococcus avium]|uniref:alpha-amylase family glycosyl hydrolase n=1 Tax=Enterococcus avium TaxID=33945 RepID=UPI0010CA2D97|nr:alpha-amylase family glycosyl hydrolase [Enterococcus avium]QCQ12711.1 sugar phosphorylase [Enterococcus avium]